MPSVHRVLETGLYVADLERAIAFYEQVIGLRVMSRRDTMAALDGGSGSVLLLFVRGATDQGSSFEGGRIPPHHGTGPAHFAFAIDRDQVDAWRDQLAAHDVAIESEVQWDRGGISLYFRDPDNHSVELATPGLWPVY